MHGDLEEHLAVVSRADLEVDIVGEVEPALGLHHVREEADDVAVLAIELELHFGLVLLEILRAHVLPSAAAGARAGSTMPSAPLISPARLPFPFPPPAPPPPSPSSSPPP